VNQPLFTTPNPSETTKKCWTCGAITPYEQGFCDSCWRELPYQVRELYESVTLGLRWYDAQGSEAGPTFGRGQPMLEVFASRIRMAIVEGLIASRPRPIRTPPAPRTKVHLTLDDLGI
jgi:hypothetical protein